MINYKKIEINENEIDALRKTDEKMRKLIDLVGPIDREFIPDPFIALINSIVFQQLAYKAAITIWNRLENLVEKVTPENILRINEETLRSCGLSRTKVSYIKNISEAVINKDLDLENINKLSDQEIIIQLVKIKGIGEWTAEMFLIFSLNRKNILSFKDLGLRKGIKWLYNMDDEPTKEEFEFYKAKFSPNNTLAAFYLWEITIKNFFKYNHVDELMPK